MIATPENDHACLDAITEEIAGRLRDRDPAIVAIAETHPTTDALAQTLAAKSPLALRGTKHMLNHARDHRIADGLDHVATWNAAMLYSQDLTEALAAAREKRMPVFRD